MTVVLDTTTNNDFSYPADANNGPDFCTGIADFAGDVDAMWASGTLASRPTSGIPTNATYYATDIERWYQWSGSAWGTVLVAGAWSTPSSGSFVAGWSPGTFEYRQVADVIELKGYVEAPSGGSGVITNALPGPTLPGTVSAYIVAVDQTAGTVVRATVNSFGYLQLTSSVATSDVVSFYGCSYPLT